MAEFLDESSQLESTTLGVYRTAATVKGGRRFSFGSLVVIGDRRGSVGYGYGKANEVPPAIEKAQKDAKRSMKKIPLQGGTIPHEVTGRFAATRVKLMPASPGTGVVAGTAVRAILEMLGVTDCLTKCYGSTNTRNVVKAAVDGLEQLVQKDKIAELRGVELGATAVDDMLERGQAYVPQSAAGEKMQAPTNTVGQDRRGGRGGGRRGGGGGRGRRGPSEAPAPAPAAAEAPVKEAPAEASGGEETKSDS
ncbi:MAG: 30S ribosomal protein S5 [Planctomycetota bacterium]|jgi:small subunit ribosomal protein S5